MSETDKTGESHPNDKTSQANDSSQVFATDDSGVVIPIEQYAELHGGEEHRGVLKRLSSNNLSSNAPLQKHLWDIYIKRRYIKGEQKYASSFPKKKIQHTAEPKLTTCVLCRKVVNKSDFKNHMKEEHLVVYDAYINSEFDFCPICRCVLNNPNRFWKHIRKVHGNKA